MANPLNMASMNTKGGDKKVRFIFSLMCVVVVELK